MALTRIKTGGVTDSAITSAKIGVDVIVAEDLASNSITAAEITDNVVSADELAVTGDGTTSQFLRSDGDGTFTWAAPTAPAITAITGAAANQILTDDGDATVTSESGLTFASNVLTVTGNVLPEADNTRDLGASGTRWANIYTADLHLKNDRGDWTIVEEEDYLSITNNKNKKQYKFMLMQISPFDKEYNAS